jgi:ribose 5-phosphate isomerase A
MISSPDREVLKAAAAARALELVRPGMVIGLGSGSTARYFVEGLGRLVSQGLDVTGVPTSPAIAELASSLGIVTTAELTTPVDLAVDGADEIDPDRRLIKGDGGALTREKLVASAARIFVVIADDSKLVQQLGRGPLPVEILSFLWRQTAERLERTGAAWRVRGTPAAPYITANGNMLLDLRFSQPIADPEALGAELKRTVGVVEHGLFLGMANGCILAGGGGLRLIGSFD